MKTRNIREVKVGDIVVDHFGDEGTVMEVLSNTFAVLDVVNEPTMDCKWFTFKSAEDKGWVILPKIDRTKLVEYVGVGDSEEVEKPNSYKGEFDYGEWLSLKEVDILINLIEGRKPKFSKKKVLDRLNRLRINLLPW